MWKHKEMFTLERKGLLKQYGELDLINMIIDNDTLLLNTNNLDDFTGMIISRMSKDNFDVVLDILAKISRATMNETISAVAKDIIKGGPISQTMGSFEQLSVRNFSSLCIILYNLLNSKRTIVLRNNLTQLFTFKLLVKKSIEISSCFVSKLIHNKKEASNVGNEKSEDEAPEVLSKITENLPVRFELQGNPYYFEYSHFESDFDRTKIEIIEEAHSVFKSLYQLYDFLYFSIFITQVDQTKQLHDLYENCLTPLKRFLSEEANLESSLKQSMLAQNIPKLIKTLKTYLEVVEDSHQFEIDGLGVSPVREILKDITSSSNNLNKKFDFKPR